VGYSVSGGGDAVANGQDDLLIGAPFYDGPTLTDSGRVIQTISHLPLGAIIEVDRVGGAAANAIDGVIWTGEAAGDRLGAAVASVGDVTGDGFDDIALGAPMADPDGTSDAGKVYVIEGGPVADPTLGSVSVSTVGTTTPGIVFTGTESGEHAGSALAGTGDVNGGGTADFLVGAPERTTASQTDSGTVYVLQLDDSDGDGRVDSQDCAPSDAAVWAVPGEAQNLTLSWNSGTSTVTLTWASPIELGGLASTIIRYDTVRSASPGDFVSGAVCVESNGTDLVSTDNAAQSPGTARNYLVRAENTACGAGSAGTSSSGAQRSVRACP